MVESPTTRRTFLTDLASAVTLLCAGVSVSGCSKEKERASRYEELMSRSKESERTKPIIKNPVPPDVNLTSRINTIYHLGISQEIPSPLHPQLYKKVLHSDDSYLMRDISVVSDGVVSGRVKIDVFISDYLALRSQNHRIRSREEYARFLTPDFYIQAIAKRLAKDSSSPEQTAQQILDYVHSGIIYDASLEHEADYVRYPLETIVEGNGDCEDTTILGAALSRAAKLDVILVHFDPLGSSPGHIGYAVAGDFNGTYFKVDDKKYFYAETTGTLRLNEPASWKIGEFPKGFEQRVIDIYTLYDAPPSKAKKQHSKKEKLKKHKIKK